MISTWDCCGEILSYETLSLFYGVGELEGGGQLTPNLLLLLRRLLEAGLATDWTELYATSFTPGLRPSHIMFPFTSSVVLKNERVAHTRICSGGFDDKYEDNYRYEDVSALVRLHQPMLCHVCLLGRDMS